MATKVLRADPRFSDLPIVAMTAHALVEERERCLASGMNDQVTKPIDPDMLFAALARWAKPHGTVEAIAGQKVIAVTGGMDLPTIEGVDIPGALKRVAGNTRLYRSLLEKFAAQQADAGAQITEALRKQDQALAERLAHTVKGVAGNIGIAQVQALAGKLERAIREKDAAVPAFLTKLDAALRLQALAIRSALGESAPPAAAPAAFDAGAASAAVTRLRSLIEANDGDAGDAVQTAAEVLAGVVAAHRLDALRAAIDEFDFDGALRNLNEIAREYRLDTE